MFLVLFSNASLLHHKREQINCEDKRMLCKVMYFLHFLFRNCQKKNNNTFLNVPILCFQEHYESTQFQSRKNILISSNGKGLRLDIPQVNYLKTHYLIQDWFHLHV